MEAKVFVKGIQMGQIMPCLPKGTIGADVFNENMAANMASHFGAIKGKAYQVSEDPHGAFLIGSRNKVVAFIVPEGHPMFNNHIVLAPARMPGK